MLLVRAASIVISVRRLLGIVEWCGDNFLALQGRNYNILTWEIFPKCGYFNTGKSSFCAKQNREGLFGV